MRWVPGLGRWRLALPAVALAAVGALLWPSQPASSVVMGRFSDDDGNLHEPDIEAIAEEGITLGCGGGRYCPRLPVTRAQMASFLVRALDLPPGSPTPFVDIAASPHAADVEALATAGVTTGCAADRYCPDRPVRRDEMATFLTRALGLAPSSNPRFSDVSPASVHFGDVNAIAQEGITLGCGGGRFCPTDQVLRDQMASFLTRALGLAPIPPRLPLGDGLPVTCSKDGLACNAVVQVAHRPAYGIREGFYNVLPYQGPEEQELASDGTRVELTLDGSRVQLTGSAVEEGAERAVRWFTGSISMSPGRHLLVARWFWDGQLTQTTTVSVTVG